MKKRTNALSSSLSPYLRQHAKNPIHWQEWDAATLAQAKIEGKLIFLSIGYATCHWCHVMAKETFCDPKTAAYLNEHFVCIKVDREQRPDIDQFFMDFHVGMYGQGGWPLNAVLTPEGHPFFSLTYLPPTQTHHLPGFLDTIRKAHQWYIIHRETFKPLLMPKYEDTTPLFSMDDAIYRMLDDLDSPRQGPAFPAHCTLLFLLYRLPTIVDEKLRKRIHIRVEHMLDQMSMKGLFDHLGGGFYRYCVDATWTTPHFEKMLYDQAMHMWVYSIAAHMLKKKEYAVIVQKTWECLQRTFLYKDAFFTAVDADTGHKEGATYLWNLDEIKSILSKSEFNRFIKVYDISVFEHIHLLKKKNIFIADIEKKLLRRRQNRAQPLIDKKIVTHYNALIGIALVHAYRYLRDKKYFLQAKKLFARLVKLHHKNTFFVHSSYLGKTQNATFLEDHGSLLTFATYLHEETGQYEVWVKSLLNSTLSFKKTNTWIENTPSDFMAVPAAIFDHPIPSSVSLAEFGVARARILLEEDYLSLSYKTPSGHDFFNIAAQLSENKFHVLHSPRLIDWKNIPVNSLQIRSKQYQDCFDKTCTVFESERALMRKLK